jgi:hypothetical protein
VFGAYDEVRYPDESEWRRVEVELPVLTRLELRITTRPKLVQNSTDDFCGSSLFSMGGVGRIPACRQSGKSS